MTVTLSAFCHEHSGGDITLKFNFLTVLHRNERFSEQRRPLYVAPFRVESFEFYAENPLSNRLNRDLRRAVLEIVAAPVYSEALHMTENPEGQATISIEEDTRELWNTENATVVMILNRETLECELKKVSLVNPNSVIAVDAVASAFDPEISVMYPCFPAVIQNLSLVNNGNVLVATGEFKEVFLDWAL